MGVDGLRRIGQHPAHRIARAAAFLQRPFEDVARFFSFQGKQQGARRQYGRARQGDAGRAAVSGGQADGPVRRRKRMIEIGTGQDRSDMAIRRYLPLLRQAATRIEAAYKESVTS